MKNYKILKNKLILFVICILSVFLPLCIKTNASEEISASLTLNYEAGKTEFFLYQIASFSENGKFEVTAPFDDYVKKINGLDRLEELDGEGWRTLANTLENCVLEKKIKPMDTKESDDKGSVSWINISKGLYLILGEQTKDEKYIYTPSPVLVTVPNRDADGAWDCHPVIVHNKLDKKEIGKKTSLEVVKVWKDSGNKEKRPSDVKINLYKDGKIYDTVTLNAKNNWKYKWKGLSADHKWTVGEKDVPEFYRVEYSKEGSKVYVINHYRTPDEVLYPDSPKPEKDKTLPQTGQLWWPVPILAVLGMTAFLIGWIKRKA